MPSKTCLSFDCKFDALRAAATEVECCYSSYYTIHCNTDTGGWDFIGSDPDETMIATVRKFRADCDKWLMQTNID